MTLIVSMVAAVLILPAFIHGQDTAPKAICNGVAAVLTTDFKLGIPASQRARVEVHQCSPAYGGVLQLIVWRAGKSTPALTIDTTDFGVVQAFARANLFIVETGGATRDQVFVIEYRRDQPELVLKRVTKGTAEITVSGADVNILIKGIYAGDSPPRSESHHFALDVSGTRPQ